MSENVERIYSIKRHGTTLESCDSEPVQTPGCVQSHGVLFALRPADLSVLQVSDSCEQHLGRKPEELLGQSVAAVLGEACAARLRHCLEHEAPEKNPTYLLSVEPPGAMGAFDVAVHTLDGVVLVELERTVPGDDGGALDYYTLIRRTTARLQAAGSLAELFRIVIGEVRRITGLSRVMVYRFHPDDTGEVVAEEKREDLMPWLGFRYPPHDIPKPAREIFKKIWIRPLPEASAPLSEMVPLASPDTGRPLDMTYCALRGASVMYVEYLQNMGVAASLTLSLRREGKLWGLIACHHDAPIDLPYQLRAACEFLAQFTSVQLGPVGDREHLAYRLRMDSVHHALVARAAQGGELSGLVEGSPSLLEGIRAGGVAISQGDSWWTAGDTPSKAQIAALADWVGARLGSDTGDAMVVATDRLAAEFPPAAAYSSLASGLLAVAVSRGRRNLLLWFRPEIEQTLSWAGNPNDLPTTVGPHGPRLTPRKSFELWREIVRGRSEPWDPVEIEAARKLRLLIMDLVVSRVELLAAMNEELVRSNEELDAFAYVASHDLKEPLRGINKHAQLLRDEIKAGAALDHRAIERMETLLRLTTRMDGLLDALLHFSRVGRLQLEEASTPLSSVLQEAIEMLGSRVMESGTEIRIPRPLPTLRCERIRVREVLSNLISNALKYNDKPRKWVEVGFIDPAETPPAFYRADLAPPDAAGQVVLYVRDDGIGIEPRHHDQVFRMFKRLHPREAYGGGSGAGLAIVKKLVQQHRGVAWLDSAPGAGSTFYFTLAGAGKERSA